MKGISNMSLYKYKFSYADLTSEEYDRLYKAIDCISFNGIFENPNYKTAEFFIENNEYISTINFPDNCHLRQIQ